MGETGEGRQAALTVLEEYASTNDQEKSRKAVRRESNAYPSSLRDFFYAGTARQSTLTLPY